MSKEFHALTDKHGNEIRPTRHQASVAVRMAEAVLRSLGETSRPTIERRDETAHVSCHETQACVILLASRDHRTGKTGVCVSAGWKGGETPYEIFDSIEEFQSGKRGREIVFAFLEHCRCDSAAEVMTNGE